MLRYQEETKKAIESINAVMSHLGAAAVDLLTDRNKLLTVVAGATALALGVYGAKEGARVTGRTVERWLGTPRLVCISFSPVCLLVVLACRLLNELSRDGSVVSNALACPRWRMYLVHTHPH